MGIFDRLFVEPKKTVVTYSCDFCGKKLHDGKGKGTAISANSFEQMDEILQETLTRKCECYLCPSIFCLNCANIEGRKRGTGEATCPKCGSKVPQNQYM
jgi:hypothetical protein